MLIKKKKSGRPIADLKGKSFGRLTCIKPTERRTKGGRVVWKCKCSCENVCFVSSDNLIQDDTKSCGCLRIEKTKERMTKHGKGGSLTWYALSEAKQRCYNKNNKRYEDYGGRGIKVCKRWRGKNGYANFLSDMGKRPSSRYSLGRIDNDGPYCNWNCRWETSKQQANNRRKRRYHKKPKRTKIKKKDLIQKENKEMTAELIDKLIKANIRLHKLDTSINECPQFLVQAGLKERDDIAKQIDKLKSEIDYRLEGD